MRYGMLIDTSGSVDEVVGRVETVKEAGFEFAASSQIFSYDTLTLLAHVGAKVPDIELATAVVPTYPRHPIMLAAQALTVQSIIGDRLTLGIGLSHQIVIEGMFGYSFDRPARHMRDYLNVLMPLLRGEQVNYEGKTLKASTMGPLEIKAPPPRVLLAALAPVMLKLAGGVADGTVTWMTGRKTIDSHIVPSINKAAEEAGRDTPRVAVGLPVCVTNDPDAARERAQKIFELYGNLPSYRAMLDREGAEGPGDVAIVGDEESVAQQIAGFADAGATEFSAANYGNSEERDRTFKLMAALAKG